MITQIRQFFKKERAGELSAENGDAQSQGFIGEAYICGLRGVSVDLVEAVRWFKLSAEGGFEPSQFKYGRFLYFGLKGVVSVDKAQGLKWIKRAAEEGETVAIEFLKMYT